MDVPESPLVSSRPVVQGFLSKRKKGGLKDKKRWYVMTQRRLKRYQTKEDFDKGQMWTACTDLLDVQTVRKLTSRGSARNTFEIVTESKSQIYQADTIDETDEWVENLKRILTVRFSTVGQLFEDEEETQEIESELEKRKSMSGLKRILSTDSWRTSRVQKPNLRSSKSLSIGDDEEHALESFDFLEKSNEEQNNDPVFETKYISTPTIKEEVLQHHQEESPASSSSGVETLSTETAGSLSEGKAHSTSSSDNLQNGTTDHDIIDDLSNASEENDCKDPIYGNWPYGQNVQVVLDENSGFGQLKKMLQADGTDGGSVVECGDEGSAVMKLKEMLAEF